MKKAGIPQEPLKLIACITMLIDHIGAAIVLYLPLANLVDIYYGCRLVGRLAFPIYAFLLAEGMHRTGSPVKYILRLSLGILLAELPFDLLFWGGITWENQSVMVTLTLGALMLLGMKSTQSLPMRLCLTIPAAVLAELAGSDYGGWGIAMIAAFGLFDRLPWQLLGCALVNLAMPSIEIPVFGIPVSLQLFGVLALLPIALYNGEKVTRSRRVQWGFYLFYPVHLLLLWLIQGALK